MSGITLARAAAARGQAGHPGRELLRHRVRGAAPGRLRGGVRRLRRGDGGRRREGEGLRLPGPQRVPDPGRRHAAHAHRRGDVLDGRARLRQAVRRRPTTSCARVLARIASKNHYNGARNPRAQFRREMTRRRRSARMPAVAGELGGVRLRRRGRRRGRRDRRAGRGRPPLHRQAALREGAVVRRRQRLRARPTPTTTTRRSPRCAAAADDAYAQAGITDPRPQLAMAEVHDCFTPTELVLMEDLGFSERGTAWKDVEAGAFDLDGELPVNPDGGLKCFGHPVGAVRPAHAVRVLAAAAGRGPRGPPHLDRRPTAALALTHNLGGYPGEMVSFVGLFGSSRDDCAYGRLRRQGRLRRTVSSPPPVLRRVLGAASPRGASPPGVVRSNHLRPGPPL